MLYYERSTEVIQNQRKGGKMTGIIFVILVVVAIFSTLASIIAFLSHISNSPGSGGM